MTETQIQTSDWLKESPRTSEFVLQCGPPNCVLNSVHQNDKVMSEVPDALNVILFGNRFLVDAIKLS